MEALEVGGWERGEKMREERERTDLENGNGFSILAGALIDVHITHLQVAARDDPKTADGFEAVDERHA